MSKFKVFAVLIVVAMLFAVVTPVGATYNPPKPYAEVIKNDCKGYEVTIKNAPEHSTWSNAKGYWTDPYLTETANGKILLKWYTWEWKYVGWPKYWDWVKVWHETKIPYSVTEKDKCLREFASVDIEVLCSEEIKGSWMVVYITTHHAKFIMGDIVIEGSEKLTLNNQEAPFEYKVYADRGYKFADGSTKYKGVLEQLEKCWVHGTRRTCPECGPHQDEVAAAEGNIVQIEGAMDCVDCFFGSNYGFITTGAYLYLRGDSPFKILVSVPEQTMIDAGVPYEVKEVGEAKIKQVFIVAQAFEGLDKTYYQIIQPKSITRDNWVVFDMDGNRLDGYGNDKVNDFVACSASYGPWFVQKDGTMTLPQLMNISSSDVIAWLMADGYFDDFDKADEWIDALWKDAKSTGVIGPLPTK